MKNHKQISVPVCRPEIFSRAKLSRSILLGKVCCKSHSGNCKCLVHLCPPASVDECADGLVRPSSTGVEVGAVPRLNQAHKVGTFTLDKGELSWMEFKDGCPILKADFWKDASTWSHLSTLSCHLTFPLSLSRSWPVDLCCVEHKQPKTANC